MSDKPYTVYMLRSTVDPTLWATRGSGSRLVPFHRAKVWRTAAHAKLHLNLVAEDERRGVRGPHGERCLELVPFLLTPLAPILLSEPLAEESHDDE